MFIVDLQDKSKTKDSMTEDSIKETTPVVEISENKDNNQDSSQKEGVEVIEEKKVSFESEEKKESEEDDAIDFSAMKNKVKGLFVKKEKSEAKKEDSVSKSKSNDTEEETPFDFKDAWKKGTTYFKKNTKWITPLLLILIVIFVSTYLRMMPSDLPITDSWAENTALSSIRNQIEQQVNSQYPNLPEQNRDALVEREFNSFMEQNSEQLKREIAQLSGQFKSQFQDENGYTYLIAIDPYLWYSQAKNVLEHGHLGDKLIDGEAYFSLRDGRLDKKSSMQLHPYIGAYLYKVLSIFNGNITLMRALFLLPAILIALAVIPTFFIGKKVAGNVGGFFASLFLVINGPVLGRTAAGFSDTDPYNILFPLLVIWLFLEAYTAKQNKNRWILSGVTGLTIGLYAATWTGWSTVFLYILVTLIGTLILDFLVKFVKHKYKISKDLVNPKKLRQQAMVFLGVLISSGIFVSLFQSFSFFWYGFTRPIRFIYLKEVAVRSIWPNVLTTVAEFNTTSFSNIINQMGGNFLFALSIVGVLLLLFHKKSQDKEINFTYFIIIGLWFASTMYAFTKGIRFALLIAPPFALSLGSAFGFMYERGSKWLHKSMNLQQKAGKVIIFVILALFLISPLATAQQVAVNEVPTMNDGWYDVLTKIKQDNEDSIITSWWDFGHWFVAISERRVTFDGGDQGERIHWVGRSLQTDDEQEAVGILRMLNCAQETAPHVLDEMSVLESDLASVELIKEVILLDRSTAEQKYSQAGLSSQQVAQMIELTHCQDLLPNYYITSEDMVGKGGVWGHFGSWDFTRAAMYQDTIMINGKEGRQAAITNLEKRFGLTQNQALTTFSEITTTKADRWVAPWPGYLSSLHSCSKISETEVGCPISVQGRGLGVVINTETFETKIQGSDEVELNSLVYATDSEVIEKKFDSGKQKAGVSVVLIPREEGYSAMATDPLQAASIFTKLFFFNGHGLECFDKFDDRQEITGNRVITWEVDYTCQSANDEY